MNARIYLRWFFGPLITVLLIVSVVNASVDPYGMFDLIRLSGLNAEKPQRFTSGGRIEKSIDLRFGRYDTLILGSSRAQIGIDPVSPALAGGQIYNAGFSLTNMYELLKIGSYALDYQKLERVIFGIDFLMFSRRRTVSADFGDSGFAGHSLGYTYLRHLISIDALQHSAQTLQFNLTGNRSAQRLNGYRDGTLRFGRADPRRLFTSILEDHFFVNPETYAAFDYDLGRVDMLRELIGMLVSRGVSVYLFISPVHARQLEAIEQLGLFPTFERWKRDVVAVVEEVNRGLAPSHRPVAIWDFTGYNSITTEAVPAAGEGKATKWFWESSHYKREVGDMVLLRMLHPDISATSVPAGFGVMLASETLEAHFEGIRLAARRYRENHPFEVADIEQLARKTESIRRSLN